MSGNVAFEARHGGLLGVAAAADRAEGLRDSDIWGAAQSGVVSRCVSGAELAILRRFTIATWVFHGASVAAPLLALAGLLFAPVATPFVLKVLPAFLPFLVAGIAAAERALCRCSVCGGPLLGGFWAFTPRHRSCWLPDERASDQLLGELCRAGSDTYSDSLQASALRE